MLFWLKKLAAALLLPPVGLFYLLLAGLLLRRRAPRLAAALLWSATLALLALSLPLVAHRLAAAAGSHPALDPVRAREAQAIVILGGGLRRQAPEYGGDTVGERSLERVRYGARLARRYGLPVLVSGGAVYGGMAEAQAMREALETDFGVTVRWTESASRDTAENARHSAAVLRSAGLSRVLLVTDSLHMRRAETWFAGEGLHVIAAPTGVLRPFAWDDPLELLPSPGALLRSWNALHELAGQAVQGLAGVAVPSRRIPQSD